MRVNKKVEVIALFSMGIFSSVPAFAITHSELVGELMNVHGSNWESHFESTEEKAKIKEALREIINHSVPWPGGPFTGMVEFDYRVMRSRAIAEFGKFLVSANGTVNSNDLAFLQQQLSVAVKTREERDYRIQLLQSLRNANAPATTRLLLNVLNQQAPHSEEVHFAVRAIGQVFAVSKAILPALKGEEEDGVHSSSLGPDAGMPLSERHDSKAWLELGESAQITLNAIQRNENYEPYIRNSARVSIESINTFNQNVAHHDSTKKDNQAVAASGNQDHGVPALATEKLSETGSKTDLESTDNETKRGVAKETGDEAPQSSKLPMILAALGIAGAIWAGTFFFRRKT